MATSKSTSRRTLRAPARALHPTVDKTAETSRRIRDVAYILDFIRTDKRIRKYPYIAGSIDWAREILGRIEGSMGAT